MTTPSAQPNLIFVTTPHGDFLAPDGDLVTVHLQKFGGHTRPHVALLRHLLVEDSGVMDIGAHIGSFSIPLGLELTGKGNLLALEPDPISFAALQMNLAINGLLNNSTPIRAAVTDGRQKLYLERPDQQNTGSTFLVEADSGSVMTDPVAVIALDDLLTEYEVDRLDLVKIDVEGMEAKVLAGGKESLKIHQPFLFFEVSSSQLERAGSTSASIADFLVDLGYQFYLPIGQRNRSSDQVDLRRIGDFNLSDPLFDVLAVPRSRRLPSRLEDWLLSE